MVARAEHEVAEAGDDEAEGHVMRGAWCVVREWDGWEDWDEWQMAAAGTTPLSPTPNTAGTNWG